MNKKIIGIIIGLLGFALLLGLVLSGNNQTFDDTVRFWVYGHRIGAVTLWAKFVSLINNPMEVIIFCAILLAIPATRKTYGLPISIGALSVTIINKTIKHTVMRARPDDLYWLVTESGYSFPSGHSITSMFVYGTMIYLISKNVENRTRATVLLVICALVLATTGPSRVYVGVHYPTDVLAGWCLGLVAICVTIIILEHIEKRGKINGNH